MVVRLYGEITHERGRVDYRPYRRQTMLYLTCSMIPSVDLARCEVSRAQNLGICEMCYNNVSALVSGVTMQS